MGIKGSELALLRIVAQRIAGGPLPTAADVVQWLTAAQAQEPNGVLTSVALRMESGSRAAVEAAFDAGEVVKSWPMRGTLHLVAAEDLPWLLEVTAPRPVAAAASRRAQLGLDEATLERARQLALKALAGGGRLGRAELMAVWEEGGVGTTGQRGYHMLGHLAQTGLLCFGPTRAAPSRAAEPSRDDGPSRATEPGRADRPSGEDGTGRDRKTRRDGEQLVVLVDEWITRPRRPERDEALGELASRYFRGHGPATVKDFTRWTNLTAADVRTGLAIARPLLSSVEVDGREYLMDPATPELLAGCRRRAKGVFLLPGFDEFMLGYADRGAALPAAYADRIVPGGNGVFRPTVVSDGQVVGVWKRAGDDVVATPFTSFADRVAAAIPKVYAALP